MSIIKKISVAIMAFTLPVIASAQYYVSGGTSAQKLLVEFGQFIKTATPILVGLAILWVIYNAFKLIQADDKTRGEAKTSLMWSIIAVVAIVGFWAIALAVLKTFGLGAGSQDISNYIPGLTY